VDDRRRHRIIQLGLVVYALVISRRYGLLRLVVDLDGRLKADDLVVAIWRVWSVRSIWFIGCVVCAWFGDLQALR
jgi:hypothetical protein